MTPSSISAVTRIANLKRLVEAHKVARPGEPRAALRRALRDECAQAIADSFSLYTRLSTQWTWLSANQRHELHDEREAAYLANLEDYSAIEDAIGAAHCHLDIDDVRSRSFRASGDDFEPWRRAYVAATGAQ